MLRMLSIYSVNQYVCLCTRSVRKSEQLYNGSCLRMNLDWGGCSKTVAKLEISASCKTKINATFAQLLARGSVTFAWKIQNTLWWSNY